MDVKGSVIGVFTARTVENSEGGEYQNALDLLSAGALSCPRLSRRLGFLAVSKRNSRVPTSVDFQVVYRPK